MDSLDAMTDEAEADMRAECERDGHRVVGLGLVSATVAAKLVACSKSTLRNFVKSGKIKPASCDATGHCMFHLRELARYAAQNRQNAQRLIDAAIARNLPF
ncbi:helix-turn-helix domain-containing protein [Paraburkholderia adhaesiva]|uniref:helix-turn-helix domain-containing protein n=1 Tax=Paraburkholderia adhaesiva TaxID=2883244 RepID=UPI001F2BCEFA|nr:helix-turn-helix domain-containing protein [Paraburkholderia adhaesiva]